jgi:hypothetical protein
MLMAAPTGPVASSEQTTVENMTSTTIHYPVPNSYYQSISGGYSYGR